MHLQDQHRVRIDARGDNSTQRVFTDCPLTRSGGQNRENVGLKYCSKEEEGRDRGALISLHASPQPNWPVEFSGKCGLKPIQFPGEKFCENKGVRRGGNWRGNGEGTQAERGRDGLGGGESRSSLSNMPGYIGALPIFQALALVKGLGGHGEECALE